MERIAKERYEGKHKAGELDEAYIRQVYKEVCAGAAKGYGKTFTTVVNDRGEPSPEVLQMRQNLYKFSMVKNYAMLQELNQHLSGGKQAMRWEAFKQKALQLNKKYNLNYLQAEWQTALQAGKHAVNWQEYERNKDLYPNLKYKTQGDKRVRDEHKKLDGIIAPIDSDFWAVHYPPNGWRCRCYVVQTAEAPSEEYPTLNEKELRPEFRNNVGKGGEVFKETDENKGKPHPYFALAKTAGSETKKAFEYAKLAAAPHTIYKGKNGGRVRLNIFADRKDLLSNYKDAKLLVDEFGVDIEIRAHLDGHIVKNIKNPEYNIDNQLSDRKAPTEKNYKKILKKAASQNCKIVVINNERNNDTEKNMLSKIRNVLRIKSVHPSIQVIITIIDGNIKRYERGFFK